MALLFSHQNTKIWVYLQSNNHSFIHSLKYLLTPRQVKGQETFSVKGQRIKYFRLCGSHMVSVTKEVTGLLCFIFVFVFYNPLRKQKPFLAGGPTK